MNKITYVSDNQFLLDLFNKSEYINDYTAIWQSALSINDIKNKYGIFDNINLMHLISKSNISIYQYSIFLDDSKTLFETITNKKSKGYYKYFEYLQKLDKDIFGFTRYDSRYNYNYIITFNIIEYYDAFKNMVLYSFLNSSEFDSLIKEKIELDSSPVTDDEAVEIIKNEISNISLNYNHVIPNSHMFFKLDQIIMAINRNEDLDFIKTGIQNSIKNGYEISKNNE